MTHVCSREKSVWENFAMVGIVLVFKGKLNGTKLHGIAIP